VTSLRSRFRSSARRVSLSILKRPRYRLLLDQAADPTAMHEGTPHIFLARPLKSAELVKCVRAILHKEHRKRCFATDVARQLGINRRTLGRHLSSNGTTFRRLSQQVLLQAAQRLLKAGASVSDVSGALGFSEVSAFTRAFRRWSGETPSSWRLRHQIIKAEQPRSRHERP
jgi:AraC-like DNA-binding protein